MRNVELSITVAMTLMFGALQCIVVDKEILLLGMNGPRPPYEMYRFLLFKDCIK